MLVCLPIDNVTYTNIVTFGPISDAFEIKANDTKYSGKIDTTLNRHFIAI